MKRLFVFWLLVFSAAFADAQQLNLDTVIERAARSVEETLQQGTKVAILNFVSTSETFSDYVIDELTGKLVTGRKITIVDRRNLALISQEMHLQLSGDVSDESAQSIGRLLGAQSIVSGALTNMGTFYRFRVRVINVETAAIQTQISLDLRNDAQVAFLFSGNQNSQPDTSAGTVPGVTTHSIEGTIVPGANLTAKLVWLQRNADSHNTYILEVNANENIAPQTFEYSGAINITIILRGDNVNRNIRLRSNDSMFTVKPNVTFILENNITLQGHRRDSGTMVWIQGGTFIMRTGSAITGNIATAPNLYGTAVNMWSGSFEMSGGTISGNTVSTGGGGVYVGGGAFTMTGGTISGNTAARGGGVFIENGGIFNMSGGTISGNTATSSGGGVNIGNGGIFNKSGGTVTGYNTDQNNGNVVRDDVGTIARSGHAVWVSSSTRKETTAGSNMNLSYGGSRGTSGAWDN